MLSLRVGKYVITIVQDKQLEQELRSQDGRLLHKGWKDHFHWGK